MARLTRMLHEGAVILPVRRGLPGARLPRAQHPPRLPGRTRAFRRLARRTRLRRSHPRGLPRSPRCGRAPVSAFNGGRSPRGAPSRRSRPPCPGLRSLGLLDRTALPGRGRACKVSGECTLRSGRPGRGVTARRWSSPPSNGCTGTTTGACSSPSDMCLRLNSRHTTTTHCMSRRWPPDSSNSPSGIPGAVQGARTRQGQVPRHGPRPRRRSGRGARRRPMGRGEGSVRKSVFGARWPDLVGPTVLGHCSSSVRTGRPELAGARPRAAAEPGHGAISTGGPRARAPRQRQVAGDARAVAAGGFDPDAKQLPMRAEPAQHGPIAGPCRGERGLTPIS